MSKSQTVSVDVREGEYIVCSYSIDTEGFRVMNGSFARLASSADPAEIGTTVLEHLDLANQVVQHRDLTKKPSPFDPVLKALKLRSFAAYMVGTREVDVERQDARVTLTPMRNEGTKGGFTFRQELAVALTGPSERELGEAIIAALSLAT